MALDPEIEELEVTAQDTARDVSPVQFFRPEDAIAERDFRPIVSSVEAEDTSVRTEDGHGRPWRPPALVADKVHDPHVSGLPEPAAIPLVKETEQSEQQQSLPFAG